MSLNAPYSLAKSGTNPFWTEPQISSHDAGQQQMVQAAATEDSKPRTRSVTSSLEGSHGNNSYVPPETVLAKTGNNSRGYLESENVNDPDQKASCSGGPGGYPAPVDSFSVQLQSSQTTKQIEPDQHSFSGKNPIVSGVTSNHTKKERPQSLQVTSTSKPAASAGTGAAQHQGQSPVKGILKKPSGSVSFDTTIQISEGGTISNDTVLLTAESTGFNNSDYPGIINLSCNYYIEFNAIVMF